MKPYIFRALAAAGCVVALTACDENYWNEHELPGFEEKLPDVTTPTDKKTVEYTLTDADYEGIAKNSTNKALAEAAGVSKALAAVGTQHCFNSDINPADYLPAYMGSNSFTYYALTEGSAIQLTYKTSTSDAAQTAAKVAGAPIYTVSIDDYKGVWGSDDDYVQAFAPSKPAAKELPDVLMNAYPDAEEGDYVVVTYNTADTDPVFSQPDTPDTPGFTLSNVLGTAAVGDELTVNGYVSALSTNGCILTDASGSLFVYNPTDLASLKIGDQIVLSGTVSSYRTGLQVAAGSTFEIVGEQAVTYPEPRVLTGADLDEIITRTDDQGPIFCQMTGKVAVNGNNINIIVAGAETAQGSAYYTPDDLKALLVDGTDVTIQGYLISVTGGRYTPTVITSVKPATTSAGSRASAVTVASEKVSAVYCYDGSDWTLATDYVALSHADYQAMGQKYDNLSTEEAETIYLPRFMNVNYPYAMEGDQKYVVYFWYASSTTSVRCQPFIFRTNTWELNNGVETVTAQYVCAGNKWMYDPNIEITLPAGRNQPLSTLYFQACVDWVAANVPNGAKYVTSSGNNEYYTGASAYQGNIDLRPDKAIAQYPEAYAGMTDEQVIDTEKRHFALEVFPAVLGQLHPDAEPIAGVDVLYTINFYVYNGSTTDPESIVYKVVAKGKFEFVSCTWWPDGVPAE